VLQGAVTGPVPTKLKRLCESFIELQQARHEADYDLTRGFARREVLDLASMAEQSFQDWATVAGSQAADALLVALLLRKNLDR